MKQFNHEPHGFRPTVGLVLLFVALQAFDLCRTVYRAVHWLYGEDKEAPIKKEVSSPEKLELKALDVKKIKEFHYAAANRDLDNMKDILASVDPDKMKPKLVGDTNPDRKSAWNPSLGEKASALLLNSLWDEALDLSLVKDKATILKSLKSGTTALYKAIMHRSLPVAKFLIEQKGIDIAVTKK